jgi:hypothetical protein
MKRREPTDLAASVRQRLLDISRRTKTDANLIWTRYAVERLLFRLASSEREPTLLEGRGIAVTWPVQAHRRDAALTAIWMGLVAVVADFRP